MKILIELPTWLGDAVMATPSIESLISNFSEPKVTLIGSFIAIEVLKNHPKVVNTFILEKNYISFFKTVSKLEEFDIYFSFRSSLRSKLMKLWISAKKKYHFDKKIYAKGHQVEKYSQFVGKSLGVNFPPGKILLYVQKKNFVSKKKKLLGINPGASYGSAKRWYPKEFASLINALSNEYDVIIFGGQAEIVIAQDIEDLLIKNSIQNYQNLAGRTSIGELINRISTLDLLITGDSGPMHLAAAFQIPTVSIFGPTNYKETSQWMNPKSRIVRKSLDCQPCMKRVCPLKHHNCMKMIKSSDVLKEVALIN